MNDLFGDSFGNYMLHGIDEIELPEPVSWLPQTLGWKLLGLALLLWLGWRIIGWGRRWWHNRYRRSALARLAQLEQQAGEHRAEVLAALPELLKATALQAYPRSDVASLSGHQWLAFLDAHYNGPAFCQAPGNHILAVAYQAPAQWQLSASETSALINMCRRWLAQHQADADAGADHA